MTTIIHSFVCCSVLLSAACGVHAYPHLAAQDDSSKDFAPTGQGDMSPVYVGADASAADAAASGSSQTADAGIANEHAAEPELVLGDAHLHKEDVLAFIHFGHSNMLGRAVDPAELRAYNFSDIHPRAWQYHVGMPPQPALEPTARAADEAASGGPGTALVKQAAERSPGKYFMSLGYGVSGIYCKQFLPGGVYYDLATKSALAIKDRVTFVAIVLMLGSTEIHGTDADRAAFPECVDKLVTAVREALDRPDLPLLISGYEMNATGMYAADGDFAKQIIPQIEKVPSVVSNSVVVPADGLDMQDGHHFNLNGHKVWTGRVLDTMKAKGWAPWMTQ